MPSKSKKHSKTPSPSPSSSSSSKLQSYNNNNNPQQTPIQEKSEENDEFLEKTLEEASSNFPSFISKSSLTALLSDLDTTSSQQKGSTIWLSHASITSFSISPASLVSVSLPPLQTNFRKMNGLLLSSLAAQCSQQLGLDWEPKTNDKAANFFVLATAFPSNKLVMNQVRISSNLSYSLGCPTTGRTLFVHCIRGGPLNSFAHSNREHCGSHVDHSSVCEELYIRSIPCKTWSMDIETSSPLKKLSDKPKDGCENGEISSPRTPSLQHSRPCSPTPSKSSLLSLESSVSRLRETKRSYFDSVEIQQVLADKNAKKLLEHTAASWLHSRTLLCGNLVTIPVLSRLCLFEVVAMKSSLANGDNEAITNTSRLIQHTDDAHIINTATKINICLESDFSFETPDGSVSKPDKTYVDKRDEVMQLGGLRKEYRLLRDIISSSMKNDLSRFKNYKGSVALRRPTRYREDIFGSVMCSRC